MLAEVLGVRVACNCQPCSQSPGPASFASRLPAIVSAPTHRTSLPVPLEIGHVRSQAAHPPAPNRPSLFQLVVCPLAKPRLPARRCLPTSIAKACILPKCEAMPPWASMALIQGCPGMLRDCRTTDKSPRKASRAAWHSTSLGREALGPGHPLLAAFALRHDPDRPPRRPKAVAGELP